jgi:hypothetical protein
MFAGKQAAKHDVNYANTKILFPKINNAGTVRPTNGPAMYQAKVV